MIHKILKRSAITLLGYLGISMVTVMTWVVANGYEGHDAGPGANYLFASWWFSLMIGAFCAGGAFYTSEK